MQTNEQRKFWVQKNPEQEWQTLKIAHPDIAGAVRIVANTFKEQTFNGEVYLPAPMQLKEPENGDDLKNSASATFPRAVIGQAVRELLDQISDSGWLVPFSATICTWRESDRLNPQKQYDLYIDESGISMNQESVTLTLSDDNPMIRPVAILYDPEIFQGLQLQQV